MGDVADTELLELVVGLVRAGPDGDVLGMAVEGLRRVSSADSAVWVRVAGPEQRVLASAGLGPAPAAGPDAVTEAMSVTEAMAVTDALRTGRRVAVEGGYAVGHGSPGAGDVVVLRHGPDEHLDLDPRAVRDVIAVAVRLAGDADRLRRQSSQLDDHELAAQARVREDADLRTLVNDLLRGTLPEMALATLSERIGGTVYLRRSAVLGSGPAETPGPYGDPPTAGPDDRLVDVPGTDLARVGASDPTTPSDSLLDRIATVVGLELARQRTAIETEIRLGEGVIAAMLDGDLPGLQTMWYRASLAGIDIRSPRVLVWLGTRAGGRGGPDGSGARGTDESPADALSQQLRDRIRVEVRSRSPRSQVFHHQGDVVVLWTAREAGSSGPGGVEGVRRQVEDVLRSMDDGSVVAGLSDVCTGATQHVAAARECRFAHRVLAARGGPSRTLAIADLGTFRLLAHVASPEVGRAAARTHLGPLLEPDASDRGELLHTLRTYLAHDRRGTETASALHVHVNTLRYRVQRIEELLGVSLDDADTRSSLQLALHLWDLPTPASPAGTPWTQQHP